MNGWFLWDQLVDRYTIISWILEDILFWACSHKTGQVFLEPPQNCRESLNHRVLEPGLEIFGWSMIWIGFFRGVSWPIHGNSWPENMDQWSKVCIYKFREFWEIHLNMVASLMEGIRRLPVEVGSLSHHSHCCFLYIPDISQMVQNFFHVSVCYMRLPSKTNVFMNLCGIFMMDKISISWIYPWPRMPVQKIKVFPGFFRSLVVTDDSILGGVDPTHRNPGNRYLA